MRRLCSFLCVSLLLLNSCAAEIGPTPAGVGSAKALAIAGQRAEMIDAIIRRELDERHIAGASLAIVRDGAVLYAKGYGSANLEEKIPARADTRFLIASITKMFTAVAVMILVREAKLSLDSPIGPVTPGLPAQWQRVTVHQLLTHTSGVPSFTTFAAPPCGRRKAEADYDANDVLDEVNCLPLDFEPGTDWRYSDTGYHLLGLIIERASGLSYEAFLEREIFRPLQMQSTRLIAKPGEYDDRAVGYRWHNGAHERAPAIPLHPLVEMSTGGLASNVIDLARFDGALANGTLVPKEVLASMWKPAGIGSALYGMGFAVRPINGRRQVGHTGGGPGATTSFARFQEDGMTVILLTNTAQPPFSVQEIIGKVAQAVLAPAG